ncbi:MAG: potassium transporter TrkG, partial [Sneathiella sp.]
MLLAPAFMILGWSLVFLSGLMVLPLLFSLLVSQMFVANSFFMSAIITVFLGGGLVFATRTDTASLGRRETFLTATLIWVIVPLFAALPLYLSDAIPSATNAYFEALSGFTTNGASIIENLDEQAPSVLLWRSLIQWVGGFTLIVFVSLLASAFNIPGNNPLTRAIAKSTRRRLSRRIRFAVLSILKIYALL